MVTLHSAEKKGIVVLLILLICLVVFPKVLQNREIPFTLLSEPAEITESEQDTSRNNDTLIRVEKTVLPRPKRLPPPPIELNTVDSISLVSVKGIGPYYAAKILLYREQLGGFHHVNQLKDLTYNYLDIDSILPRFTVDPSKIRKLDMDTMSFRSVLRHPYLEYEDVVLIFNAKRKEGNISYSVLEKKGVLAPHKLRKIKPYFL